MKEFKSILALTASVLALSACVAPFSAFAEGDITTITPPSTSGSMQVNYTKSEEFSYTVTIPASVNITGDWSKDKCTISVGDIHVQTGYGVLVSLVSANYENDFHRLKLESGNDYIPYLIKVNQQNMGQDSDLFLVDEDYSTDMFFELMNNDDAPAGDYRDILTFSVWCRAMP